MVQSAGASAEDQPDEGQQHLQGPVGAAAAKPGLACCLRPGQELSSGAQMRMLTRIPLPAPAL